MFSMNNDQHDIRRKIRLLEYNLPYADKIADRATVFLSVRDLLDGGGRFTTLETRGERNGISDFATFNGREVRTGIRFRF